MPRAERCEHIDCAQRGYNRRSFICRSVATLLAAQGAIHAALIELSQPAEQQDTSPPPRTHDEMLQTLYETLGYNVRIQMAQAKNDIAGEDTDSVQEWELAQLAWNALRSADASTPKHAANFLSNYRLSDRQQAADPTTELDCNDHANRACELLSQRGMPMYLLSAWPEDAAERHEQSWHQMAVCKLSEQYYFIANNGDVTLWEGSLQSFVAQQQMPTVMRPIPAIGIARYIKPKYDTVLSKFLLQSARTVQSERAMESLNILPPTKNTAPLT